MKINRIKLLEALETVGAVTGRRTTMPILNCVRLGSKSGRLQIRGSDLDRDVTAEVDCDGELAPVCVPIRLLAAFPQDIGAESIEINQAQAGWVQCVGGSRRASMPHALLKDFPADLNDTETAMGANTADIADGIEAVAWACVSDQNDFVNSCVRIHAKDNKIICEACDKKTLAYFSRNSIAAEFDILVPAQSAISAIKFLRMDGAVLSVGEKSISVKYDGGRFSARLAKANPIASYLLLDAERQTIGQIKRGELLSALTICGTPDVGGLFQIEFQFSSNGLTLECEESGLGFGQSVSGQFTPLIMRLNVERARAALRSIKDETLTVFSIERGLGFRFGDCLVIILRVQKVPKKD